MITGTQIMLHTFVNEYYSNKSILLSHASKQEKVYTNGEELSPKEISGYVTCVYDNQWWVAYILEIHNDTEEIILSFLHPHGPSKTLPDQTSYKN